MIANLLILFNVFLIESILSVDNAAVLAIMVKDLPKEQQSKALKYGILGAFLFRGLCMFFAAWVIKIVWLKVAGGLYLLYLVYGHFNPGAETIEDGIDKKHNKLFLKVKNSIGAFATTIILVEIMDIAFSIDNIFAAVAITDNLFIIILGVCIGIVAMRFVAQWFTVLIKKHPSLETSAFRIIFILGIKLIVSALGDYSVVFGVLKPIIESHYFNLIFGIFVIIIFLSPIIKSKLTK